MLAVAGACLFAGTTVAQEAPQALPTTPVVLTAPEAGKPDYFAEVIATSKGFLLSWTNLAPGENSALVRSFNAKGTALKPAVKLKAGQVVGGAAKLAALGGDKFAIIWQNMDTIEGGVFDLAQNKVTGVRTIGKFINSRAFDVVRLSNGRLAVIVLQANISKPPTVTYRAAVYTLDDQMKVLSGPTSLNGGGYKIDSLTQAAPDVAIADGKTGGFAFWRDRPSGDLLMRKITPQGATKGASKKVNTTPLPLGYTVDVVTFNVKAVRLTNNRILVTWTSLETFEGKAGYDIRARLFTANGTPIGKDFRVNTERLETQFFPAPVALPNGEFAIAWVSNVVAQFARTHWLRVYKADGKPRGAQKNFQVASPYDLNAIDTSLARLTDGSLVHVFHDSVFNGQRIMGDGIPASELK